jgi:tetrahydromethanopterin S-methyltransferase subunit E
MTSAVKYYHSSMTGAPQMTNQWGDMTSMLTAVLVTGFNLKTVTAMVRVGDLVTATVVLSASSAGVQWS